MNDSTALYNHLDPQVASTYYWDLRKRVWGGTETLSDEDFKFVVWYEKALRSKPITYGCRPFFLEVCGTRLWFEFGVRMPKINTWPSLPPSKRERLQHLPLSPDAKQSKPT